MVKDPLSLKVLRRHAAQVVAKDPTQAHALVAVADKFANAHMSYGVSLEKVQAEFVGEAGATLYQYITTLHGRLAHQEPYASIHGFQSWDYGNPGIQGGKWKIRVWGKSGHGGGWDQVGVTDPNLLLVVDFSNNVEVDLLMGNSQSILKKSLSVGQATPSAVGMACGEAWEKLMTGSVDYGDH